MSEWIKVSDRLPEISGRYVVALVDHNSLDTSVSISLFLDGRFRTRMSHAAYWIELPDIPDVD